MTRSKLITMRVRIVYCAFTGTIFVGILSTCTFHFFTFNAKFWYAKPVQDLALALHKYNNDPKESRTSQRSPGTLFHTLFIIALILTLISFSHAVVTLVMAWTSPSAKRKRHLCAESRGLAIARSGTRSGTGSPGWVSRVLFSARLTGKRNHDHGPQTLSRPCSGEMRQGTPQSKSARGKWRQSSSSVLSQTSTIVGSVHSRESGTGNGTAEMSTVAVDTLISTPPPAYGRWKGSVKLNPDHSHWQRTGSVGGRETCWCVGSVEERYAVGYEDGEGGGDGPPPDYPRTGA